MVNYKRSKKNRNKSSLFNPHKNGISSYDIAYLSSKKSFLKNKTLNVDNDPSKNFFVA